MNHAPTTPAEWAAADLAQADAAGVPVALVKTEHLRALLAALGVARIGLTHLSQNDEYAKRALDAMDAHATQEVPR